MILLLQFFHDVQFLDEDLGLFLKLMNSNTMRERVETQEADVMCKHLRVKIYYITPSFLFLLFIIKILDKIPLTTFHGIRSDK